MRASELTPLLAAAAVIGMLWLALPIRLPATAADRSLADCLTMADAQAQDVAALERCHALVPNDVELSADLAAAFETAGRGADAVSTYRAILELDPSYAEVRLRLARLLRAAGDTAGAREQVREALRIQPNRKALVDFAAELDR